ncbi:MAG: PstS family phosphate ABC transporter substrate-binding protein [Moheibacter sp.]
MVYSEFIGQLNLSVQKIIKLFIPIILSFFFLSCGNEKKELTHQEGEMTIYADTSNKGLLDALTEIYSMKFPKVKFTIVYKPENQILIDLQDTIASAAFINKPLSEQQTKFIAQKTNVTPRSTLLAYDAAIFITSINNPTGSISMEDIEEQIFIENSPIVFDNGNSGNFNTVKEVLKLEIPDGKAVQAMNNAQEVTDFVQKSPQSIGVIGLNEISEVDNPDVKELLKHIKVLSVIDKDKKAQKPTVPNIRTMNYPFSKGVYFIVREPGFGIGSGFSRFAGSNQGQLIVKREGLQPNFLYDREVQINLQNVE